MELGHVGRRVRVAFIGADCFVRGGRSFPRGRRHSRNRHARSVRVDYTDCRTRCLYRTRSLCRRLSFFAGIMVIPLQGWINSVLVECKLHTLEPQCESHANATTIVQYVQHAFAHHSTVRLSIQRRLGWLILNWWSDTYGEETNGLGLTVGRAWDGLPS